MIPYTTIGGNFKQTTMKQFFALLSFFFPLIAFGQFTWQDLQTVSYDKQETIWLGKIDNPEITEFTLTAENVKAEYIQYDFSTLLIPRFDFLGFIDTTYRRIKIYFTSVAKNSSDASTYDVKGISIVNNTKCNFNGNIKFNQIRKYKDLHFGVDAYLENAGIKAEGLIIADYEFKEDSTQKNSGIFKGIITFYWYMDKFGILHYDDIDLHSSDRYYNNQYVGTWKEYGKTNYKVCNWGEWRIPFAGNLDIGAAEFSPNPIYKDRGWKDLVIGE